MGSRFGITAFPGLGDLLHDTTCNSALSVRNLNGSCSIVFYLIYPSLIQLMSWRRLFVERIGRYTDPLPLLHIPPQFLTYFVVSPTRPA